MKTKRSFFPKKFLFTMLMLLMGSIARGQQEAPFPPVPSNVSSSAVIGADDEPGERLIITGTVFKPDKKTPYEGLVLYLYQTDATGVYNRSDGSWKSPRLHGWVKTDVNGRYEIRAIKPGSYPGSRNPAHIHVVVKLPGERSRWIDEFLFEDDPYLTGIDSQKGADAGAFWRVMKISKARDNVLRCVRDFVIISQ